ncbi:MAG TPA: phosphoglucomutase (alpha-D-glucose-1,6-bisphosphate-dependent) [Trueperaceae bacterium]|nr:phosphoglucomutase (alpha-D-glucose-1,6-bisphosphate-dependent) [Trueperaceae bacterium]
MSIHPLAGKPAPRSLLIDVPRLVASYYALKPDPSERAERVSFGTSGHRGTSVNRSFNEDHIAAICQAVADHRAARGVTGPLFLGADTHALSEPALLTAVEVLAANGVHVVVSSAAAAPEGARAWRATRAGALPALLPVPTPVVSHAVMSHNAGRRGDPELQGLADGVVITPSHNPPEDGGFKYNPPHGGPADTDETAAIQAAANRHLEDGLRAVKRVPAQRAFQDGAVEPRDLVTPYVEDLAAVVDLERVAAAGVRLGVDPLGGAALPYLAPLAERYGLDLEVISDAVDPAFGFMRVDHDGKVRMDCSSPYAMAGLVAAKDRYDVAFGTDPDADRHGVVTRAGGLLNPNHYLCVAAEYLFAHRPEWPARAGLGKTVVTTALLDRVAAAAGRAVTEVPVGFKWFVPGLSDGSLGLAGEESAGASLLRRDGTTWTTDKDGVVLGLLAAEVAAVTGQDPADRYRALTARHGEPAYARVDAAADAAQRDVLKRLKPEDVRATELAGERVLAVMDSAPGNGAPLGGIKVVVESGWFAARPSGTEDVYKVYAESFAGEEHLARLQAEAQELVAAAFAAAGVAS